MADKKKLTVAEILAAARSSDRKGEAPTASPVASDSRSDNSLPAEGALATPTAAKPTAAKPSKSTAANPTAGGAQSATGGARLSVADILAQARAKKAPGEQPAASTAPSVKAKAPTPAATSVATKTAVATGGAKTGVQRDTASILAAARAAAKPGPTSKADAPTRPAAKPRESVKPAEDKAAPPRTVATLPPKPIKPAKKSAGEVEDRRGFMQIALGSAMAMGFTALSVTGGLFTLGLARFMFPNVLAEPPSKFKVGFKDGFPQGKVETKYVAQYGVWVVNGDFQGQQQIYALKTVCTHLGCTPSWLEAEQKFKCPCHGSGFYKDGVNFEGPAPRPLERYAIRTADDGQLEIDKSKAFQEELGQWADPDSFITV